MTTTRENLSTEFKQIQHNKLRGVLHAYLAESPSPELAQFLAALTENDRDEWSTITREHELGAEVLIYRPAWGVDIQALLDDATPAPRVHASAVYSRLKRRGIGLRKIGSGYVAFRGDELLTRVITLEAMDEWSLRGELES